MLNPYANYFALDESAALRRRVSRESQAVMRARDLYRAMRFAGQVSGFVAWLTRRPDHLAEAAEIVPAQARAGHYAGLRTVPVSKIIASEGRSQDFDSAFHPRREANRDRWTKIATLRALGYDLPPVELIQVGDSYIVRDGHHRISVAVAMGQECIDAQVTVLEGASAVDWREEAARLPLRAAAVSG